MTIIKEYKKRFGNVVLKEISLDAYLKEIHVWDCETWEKCHFLRYILLLSCPVAGQISLCVKNIEILTPLNKRYFISRNIPISQGISRIFFSIIR